MNGFQRLSYRTLGGRAARSPHLEALDHELRKAQIPVRAEAYLASAWLLGFIVAGVATLLVVLAGAGLFLRSGTNPIFFLFVLVVPGFAYYLTSYAVVSNASSRARSRGKAIDAKLPYATNYITAMASAGVIPAEIFKSLASQEIYGEVAKEAAWVYKDLEVHGKDIVTAMRRAIERSPSDKFRDLMTGAITTVTSGGDLTKYFQQKARRLQVENRQEQQAFVETMGLMAESYVTAAVAGPLFLLVMVAIFVLMGSGDMIMLQLIIYVLLPIANIGFMFGLKAMIPEV